MYGMPYAGNIWDFVYIETLVQGISQIFNRRSIELNHGKEGLYNPLLSGLRHGFYVQLSPTPDII